MILQLIFIFNKTKKKIKPNLYGVISGKKESIQLQKTLLEYETNSHLLICIILIKYLVARKSHYNSKRSLRI